MQLTITINMDNEAFDYPEGEVNRILDTVKYRVGMHGLDDINGYNIKDHNGNTVGKIFLTNN